MIGSMVGSGVFLLPAALASAAEPTSIVAWVFTGLGAMLLALVFARFGRAIPRSGGPYAYSQRAFAGYLSVYWPKAATGWVTALIAIGLVWIATATNIAGVREGGGVRAVTTIVKFVPLLLIAVVGLFFPS